MKGSSVEALGVGVTLQALLAPESVSMGLQAKAVEILLGGGRRADGPASTGNAVDSVGDEAGPEAFAIPDPSPETSSTSR